MEFEIKMSRPEKCKKNVFLLCIKSYGILKKRKIIRNFYSKTRKVLDPLHKGICVKCDCAACYAFDKPKRKFWLWNISVWSWKSH